MSHKIPTDMVKGTLHKTKTSGYVSIVDYKTARDVVIKFIDTNSEIVSSSCNIRKGTVRDTLARTVSGVGFIGNGDLKLRSHGKVSKCASVWYSMLERCYSSKKQITNPTYKECSVTPEWHNYQNFAKWFDDNYIEGYHLDKDILHQGNKVYSPDNCIFVPQSINNLLGDNRAVRGLYKIGVSFDARRSKFESCCNIDNKKVSLGYYDNEDSANKAYKEFKYKVINEAAQLQPEPIRSALLRYVIPEY